MTLWFALILLSILVLSGAVLHILLERYLSNQVDDQLRVQSARVHGTLNPQEIPDPLDYEVIHSKLPPVDEFTSPGIYIQFIDHNGNVVVKSSNLGEQELPTNLSLIEQGFAGNVAVQTVSAGDSVKVRIMVSPMYLREQVLLLEVAQSLNHIDTTMSRVRWALLASVLLALALAAISGGAVVRNALSPVSQLVRITRSIEASSDLSRRVGYKGPPDEIGELATTFDHMIEHLDRVFQSQRDFVADASHELRGPLTVIRGNLDLLRRNLSAENRRESVRAIQRETARMVKIVDDLLLLAEAQSAQPAQEQKVALREIVLEELSRAKTLAGKRTITVDRLEDLVIMGDAQRLKQLLANLVDNAIKHTSEQGTIIFSLFKDGEWARLEVADNGIGIAPEHLPHLFDRFYRIDKARSRASGGTGLGLPIVKAVAEQHGGKVSAASELGKGSIFSVWLEL
ncbi:MAG: HAMP domain-containing sensor histidine kinase [Dehalococcoidia bacterium]